MLPPSQMYSVSPRMDQEETGRKREREKRERNRERGTGTAANVWVRTKHKVGDINMMKAREVQKTYLHVPGGGLVKRWVGVEGRQVEETRE